MFSLAVRGYGVRIRRPIQCGAGAAVSPIVVIGCANASSLSSSSSARDYAKAPASPLLSSSSSSSMISQIVAHHRCSSHGAAPPHAPPSSAQHQQTRAELLERIRELERQLQLRDNVVREFMVAAVPASADGGARHADGQLTHNPDVGRWVVSSGDEIAAAVDAGANHILISDEGGGEGRGGGGTHTLYLPCMVRVQSGQSLLIEPMRHEAGARLQSTASAATTATASSPSAPANPLNSLTVRRRPVRVVGTWRLTDRARVHAHDIEFDGDGTECAPLFLLSSGASLTSHNCLLCGAREAVYLSSSTQVVLTQCQIAGNVRGIFESFRSHCRMIGCEFAANAFHAVLLSSATAAARGAGGASVAASSTKDPQRARLESLASLGNCFFLGDGVVVAGGASSGGGGGGDLAIKKRACRGDVCFNYNPMIDQYCDVYRDGVKCVLTDAESTTGLVDASW